MGSEMFSKGRRFQGDSETTEALGDGPGRGRNLYGADALVEGGRGRVTPPGGVPRFSLVEGEWDAFLEGRPLLRGPGEFELDLEGLVVFFSFGGLPLLRGNAS